MSRPTTTEAMLAVFISEHEYTVLTALDNAIRDMRKAAEAGPRDFAVVFEESEAKYQAALDAFEALAAATDQALLVTVVAERAEEV